MDRRKLLSALAAGAAGLAGCSALGGEQSQRPTVTPAPVPTDEPTPKPTGTETPDTPEPTTTDAPGEKPAETPEPTDTPDGNGGAFSDMASIVELGTGPRTLSLFPPSYRGSDGAAVSVRFVESATADHPARLRATLRNANDWANTFVLRDVPPFQRITSASLPHKTCGEDCESTLYLAPTAGHELADRDPETERGPKGYWRESGGPKAIPKLPPTVRLGPDETIHGEYVLLGFAKRVGFPTGQYDFGGGDESGFTIGAWATNAPGPAGKSRFEDASVPSLPETESMAWYHEAGPETAAYLEPSTERAELPVRVAFTLVNHAHEPLTGNPYYWKFSKFVDGEWFHIAPWGWPVPMGAVAPGTTKTWALRAFNNHAIEYEDGPDAGSAVGYLGDGRYAFEVGMSRKKWTHAALVDLVGSPVKVVPTDGVTAERRGETVVVSSPRPKDTDGGTPATLTVERVDVEYAIKLPTLIAEQVMRWRNRGLRNTLAFFEEGVERVVLETGEEVVERALGEGGERTFTFDGGEYRASRSGSVSG